MGKWLFAVLLALQAHFAASYLVPLDAQAQRTFGGLLRWVWPWSIEDSGPFGRMAANAIPLPGFFIAATAATVLILAALSVLRIWVPFGWWKPLAIAGAVLSIVLMAFFPGLTKLLPIATALAVLGAGLGYWRPLASRA